MEKKSKYETDLSKSQNGFILSKDKFEKLLVGDISAAANMLVFIYNNEQVRRQLVDLMYEEYVRTQKGKMEVMEELKND